MDWGATLLLAGITWIDGVGRVAPGSLVLRRALGGAWVATPADYTDRARWTVIACWRPLMSGLVLAPAASTRGGDDDARGVRETDARLATHLSRTKPFVLALRLLGALALATLVLGVPWATGRFGGAGLLAGCGAALLLSAVTAGVAARALRALDHGRLASLGAAVSLLSPFAAPRAADAILAAAVGDAPQELVARRLLEPHPFEALMRPRAYDALRTPANPGLPSDDGARLADLLGTDFLTAVVAAPPANCRPEEPFCARCGAVYRSETVTCFDCGGLELLSGRDLVSPRR